jgi:hypothetical protein
MKSQWYLSASCGGTADLNGRGRVRSFRRAAPQNAVPGRKHNKLEEKL